MTTEEKKRAETEHLYQLVMQKYISRLTPEEQAEVRKSLETIVDAGTSMKAVKMENGDEPYQFFKPLRSDK